MKRALSFGLSSLVLIDDHGVCGGPNCVGRPGQSGHVALQSGAVGRASVVERQRLSCTYTPDGPFPPETYFGHFTTVGAAIGFNRGGRMVWGVLAPVSNHYRGALAGTYVGASADVSVGAGLGANALVGGSHRSIALQPLSVEANTGLDLTAGVSRLRLHFAP